jgi:peptidoglycan/LPS O-acetylase OafA/YrhL
MEQTLATRRWGPSAVALETGPEVAGKGALVGLPRAPAGPGTREPASGAASLGKRPHRLVALDGLRGLAALTVAFHHFLYSISTVVDRPAALWALKYTPLHAVWAGHQAVVLFFVLSGFVLAVPFYSRAVSYQGFVVKRIFRICVPYWAAVLLALGASHLVFRHKVPGLSTWFNSWWNDPVSVQVLLGHLLLVDSFPNNLLDPVLWSLVHEMRISLVFPFLMALLLRYGWRIGLLTALALALVGFVVQRGSQRLGYPNDYGDSFRYVLMFVVGAILCGHRERLVTWLRRLPAWLPAACLPVALLAYTVTYWYPLLPGTRILRFTIAQDYVTTLGVSAFILFGLSCGPLTRVLTSRPLRWLGKVSYSLYLLHAIVLLTMLKLLSGVLPIWALWAPTAVAALLVAAVSYRLVERPSMALGRRLAGAVEGRRTGPARQ